jgi:hypothetical protein
LDLNARWGSYFRICSCDLLSRADEVGDLGGLWLAWPGDEQARAGKFFHWAVSDRVAQEADCDGCGKHGDDLA